MNLPRGSARANFALAFVAIAVACGAAEGKREDSALEIGSLPANDLGRDIAGNPVRISDHQGKVVIVSFWASWCGPCKRELPVLAGLVKKVGPERLQVIAINFQDENKSFDYVVNVLKDLPITMLRDASGKAARKYKVHAIPRMIIVDRAGKVAADHTGYGESELPRFIDELNALLRAGTT